jgi:hypothetical protein
MNGKANERVYRVTLNDAVDGWAEEVMARNAGEAVWLAHAERDQPSGAPYTVTAVDGSEPARNFTVGQSRSEAPFSD